MRPWVWYHSEFLDEDWNRNGQANVESRVLLLYGHITSYRPILDILLWPSWFPHQQHADHSRGPVFRCHEWVRFMSSVSSSLSLQYLKWYTWPPLTCSRSVSMLQTGTCYRMNGYYNLIPVLDWIHWCIISIFLVWMIAFLPLFFQGRIRLWWVSAVPHIVLQNWWNVVLGEQSFELGNNSRHSRQSSRSSQRRSTLIPLSATCCLVERWSIATGRGFATACISFSILFSRFTGPSIYLDMRMLISPALCHDGNVDAVSDLLLVLHLGLVYRSFPVQSTPVLILSFIICYQ